MKNLQPTVGNLNPTLAALAAMMFAALGATQTATPASLSGHVLSPQGRPVRANVTLTFAAARGYPAPPHRVFTDANGAFTFTRLAAGSYALCAQVAASEVAPANSPYVDTCVWGSGQPSIKLNEGQQLAGVVFTPPQGAWLQVHVVDADHVLPQASAAGPAPLDPALQLVLKGPDGLFRHAQFVSQDAVGRNYRAVVPLKTALSLQVTSSVGNVFDVNGNELQAASATALQPNTSADLAPLTFTLHRK